MRIIGGQHGGRRLRAPRGADTRPTSDRVREAVFNILGAPAAGARVLDAFAGAGALGLEALSRGAASAVFIDASQAACQCVRANARSLGVEAAVRVVRGDALALLARWAARADAGPAASGAAFDWTFLDPPYRQGLVERALAALGASAPGAVIAPDGVVIAEHDRRDAPGDRAGCLVRTDTRRYGDTCVSFYRVQAR